MLKKLVLSLLSALVLAAPVEARIEVQSRPSLDVDAKAELSITSLELKLADHRTVYGILQRDAGTSTKADEVYRFVASEQNVRAALHLQAEGPGTVVRLQYDGPPLAAQGGVTLSLALPRFARGLALARIKQHWTYPQLTSNYRTLTAQNQMLLWRRWQEAPWHLLVPLAGDGAVADLGNTDYAFRLTCNSGGATWQPHNTPLLACGQDTDPYRLIRALYQTAFTRIAPYGRLRWEKPFPEVYGLLGWCSWNTWYDKVSAQKLVESLDSLTRRGMPLGFVLIDDGWQSTHNRMLTGFGAAPDKFPDGLKGITSLIHSRYKIPHVGVWHAFEGYWNGIDPGSPLASMAMRGAQGLLLPDPAGAFYREWYKRLADHGVDCLKVDNQDAIPRFTEGVSPFYTVAAALQEAMQTAAAPHFTDSHGGLNLLNCMEMALEDVFNWRLSNVARASDDYLPDDPQDTLDHVFQCAYNSFWLSTFAWPDYDMFQTHKPDARVHAVAHAMSGGPAYVTDLPGQERPAVVEPLVGAHARLLRLDAPGQVTRDTLLSDPSTQAIPLKMFGHVYRKGYLAAVVAAFNVNKSAPQVRGVLGVADASFDCPQPGSEVAPAAVGVTKFVVYDQGRGQARLLGTGMPFTVGWTDPRLYTVVPVTAGRAVLGLLDKYVGPAAVQSVQSNAHTLRIHLSEAGRFGVWCDKPPGHLVVDSKPFPVQYKGGMVTVSAAAFGSGAEHVVDLAWP